MKHFELSLCRVYIYEIIGKLSCHLYVKKFFSAIMNQNNFRRSSRCINWVATGGISATKNLNDPFLSKTKFYWENMY